MIILDDDYAIDTDTYSWNLCKKQNERNKETGEMAEKYVAIKYFTTLENAFSKYIDIKQKEKIGSKNYTSMKEALDDLKELDKNIRERVKLQ